MKGDIFTYIDWQNIEDISRQQGLRRLDFLTIL